MTIDERVIIMDCPLHGITSRALNYTLLHLTLLLLHLSVAIHLRPNLPFPSIEL